MKTKKIPPKKVTIPRSLSGREKNLSVREGPIVRVRPRRKRMSPRARRAESNRKRTPRKRQRRPRVRRNVPI